MYHAQKNLWDLFPPFKNNNNNECQTLCICCLLCGQGTCLPLCCYLIQAYSACKDVNMNFLSWQIWKEYPASVWAGPQQISLCFWRFGVDLKQLLQFSSPLLPFLLCGPGGRSCCPARCGSPEHRQLMVGLMGFSLVSLKKNIYIYVTG